MSTPIFQIPSVLPFLSLPSQSTSPFTSQQQNILISVANSLTSFSNVGSLTVDLYSASNTLATNGTSLTNLSSTFIALSKISVLSSNPTGVNNALSDLINAENKLSSSGTNLTTFVTNLVRITGVSSQLNTLGNDSTLISNLSTLNSFLSSPGSFIFSSLPTGLQNLGNDSTLTSNLKTLNSFLSGPSTFILSNLPSNLITLNNDIVFFSSLSTLNSFLSTPASFIFSNLPTGLQNLSNDSILTSNLTTLNNFLSNPSSFLQSIPPVSNLYNAFNIGGFFSNSITAPGFLFPLSSGMNSTQFVESLLSWTLNPVQVLAGTLLNYNISKILSPTVPEYIYNSILNIQPGGPQGSSGAPTIVRPLINSLFGVSPGTNSIYDPFGTLFAIVTNSDRFVGGNGLVTNITSAIPFNTSSSPLSSLLSYATIPWTIINSVTQTIGQFTNNSILNGNGVIGFLDLVSGNPANVPGGGISILGENITYSSTTGYNNPHNNGPINGGFGGGYIGFIGACLSNINSDTGDAFNGGWGTPTNITIGGVPFANVPNTFWNHPEDMAKVIVWLSLSVTAIYQAILPLIAATQQSIQYSKIFTGGFTNFHGGGPIIPTSYATSTGVFGALRPSNGSGFSNWP